jgi:hypothetical protein
VLDYIINLYDAASFKKIVQNIRSTLDQLDELLRKYELLIKQPNILGLSNDLEKEKTTIINKIKTILTQSIDIGDIVYKTEDKKLRITYSNQLTPTQEMISPICEAINTLIIYTTEDETFE